MLSCDADPVTERHGLLSGENGYGNYDASENILAGLPVTFRPEVGCCVSLVAAMQRDEAATSKGGTRAIVGEVVDAYCVVTVLGKAPADGGSNMIRPNITGAHKEMLTWDNFDLERLPTYDFIEGKSTEEWVETQYRWRNTTEIFGLVTEVEPGEYRKFSEGGRAFRACLLVYNYASGVAQAFNNDLLAMFSAENTLEQKKPALAAMLAYGVDIYHGRYDIGDTARKCWASGAGQSPGQFMPAVFAAALLRDETKANQLRRAAITNHGSDLNEVGPQELRQIKRGVTGVVLWGDGHPIIRTSNELVGQDWRYWADMVKSACYDSAQPKGNPNTGKKTAADPYGYIDGPANKAGSAYMGVTLGPFRGFAAAMILMPEIRRIVNTDAPIEYVDRVTRHGLWTWPDPVAAPSAEDQSGCSVWWSAKGCHDWRKSWGPRLDDVRFAIEDGRGRFTSLHGQPLKGGYESRRAIRHWAAIIALYDGEKFEENVVSPDQVVAPEIFFAAEDTNDDGRRLEAYLFCATPDAQIHYTVDGSRPIAASPRYEGEPIGVSPTTTVRAFAVLNGKRASRVRSKSWN
jgi:hypothetical protein